MSTTPFATTLHIGSGRANHTGSWRTERPVFIKRLPPCNDACPAGENIQGWLYEAESGNYEAAWRKLVEESPLPAVLGRICFHPCESACNRARIDEAVGVNAIERFLGDLALEKGWLLPSPGPDTAKRVLVVGSGPAGLSCAYHLRVAGHAVTLVDSAPQLGGMLRYGIPAYRLPRDVLDAEIARIIEMGIEVQTGHNVTDVTAERALGDYDAVFLGVGAQLGKRVDVPSGDSKRVVDAVSYLRQVADGAPVLLGRRVAVYGGGDTAIDAARTAKRLGATESVIVYRRDEAHMPAHAEELAQALAEGVEMHWQHVVNQFDGDRLLLEKMTLDADGFPVPTGEVEELGADALILALGQDTDLSLLGTSSDVQHDGGDVVVDASLMAAPGIFAGGDIVASARTATNAIGEGKKAARAIGAFVTNLEAATTNRAPLASFERLNPWYYSEADRNHRATLEALRRQSNFEEVVHGLSEENALFEARRCLSCGNCFSCDNCFGVCPDNAVIKHPDGTYEFDYDFCKGCGICVKECPCGAIEMIPELI
jgi:2-oxoacid:acceptor oxidoreductase delta subunit (pyruvate/2-ketoisovalerate family)